MPPENSPSPTTASVGDSMNHCYRAATIEAMARSLLEAAGLPDRRAAIVASTLKEAELLGRNTHGLLLLDWYLADRTNGTMGKTVEPVVLADHGSAVVWDGNRLPGAWLIHQAMYEAFQRLNDHPVVTITIKRSHHVGCHAVYLRYATQRDAMMLLMDTSPGFKVVAPFGSIEPLYSPTPISIGVPTNENPILIDFSLSSSSLGRATLHHQRGEKLAGKWLIDRLGKFTDDPSVLFADPPGSILPLGGADLGYKGFSLALMVYALSAGLTGYTSDDMADGKDSAVFLQLIDPGGFGGRDAFRRTMSSFIAMCRQCSVAPGRSGVHIPGENADQKRARALEHGINLSSECVEMLTRWAHVLGVPCTLN